VTVGIVVGALGALGAAGLWVWGLAEALFDRPE
jgi:hypothetical protein